MKRTGLLFGLFLLLILLAGCDAKEESTIATAAETPVRLTPFYTALPSASPIPVEQSTPTPLPTVTSTPRTHVIKTGEDLGGIAYQYGVTVSAIMEANPEIDPYILTVGTALVIPAAIEKVDKENLPIPTPVAVQMEQPYCARTEDGGAWCFLMVNNPLETAVENVSVRLQITGGDQQFEQTAVTPLNLIPAGGALPVGTFFAAPLPETFQAGAVLVAALPRAVDDQRYLPVEVQDLQVTLHENGESAAVKGKVVLTGGEAEGSQVWVALAAFDRSGSVIGIRRWEGQGMLNSDVSLDFNQIIYSSGGAIDRVMAWAEARP